MLDYSANARKKFPANILIIAHVLIKYYLWLRTNPEKNEAIKNLNELTTVLSSTLLIIIQNVKEAK
jgi:hypothetical protein